MNRSLLTLSKQSHVAVSAMLATLLTIWVMSAWMAPHGHAAQRVELRQVAAPAAGTIITGSFNAWGSGTGYMGDKSVFSTRLSYGLKAGRYGYVVGSAYTTQCPGVGKVVPIGWICFYESAGSNASAGSVFNPNTGFGALSPTGFAMYWSTTGGSSSYAYGQWTMKVGGAAQAPARSSVAGRRAP